MSGGLAAPLVAWVGAGIVAGAITGGLEGGLSGALQGALLGGVGGLGAGLVAPLGAAALGAYGLFMAGAGALETALRGGSMSDYSASLAGSLVGGVLGTGVGMGIKAGINNIQQTLASRRGSAGIEQGAREGLVTDTSPQPSKDGVVWNKGERGRYPAGEYVDGKFVPFDPKKLFVIGEDMAGRVKPYAKTFGGKWYQAWRQEIFDQDLSLMRNQRVINMKTIQKGYIILDYGPREAGHPTRLNYIMETEVTNNSSFRKLTVWKSNQ